MFEEKDYYMRIVHELVRMLIRLVFSKDIDRDDEEAVPLEVMEKYKKLISMIDDGQIKEDAPPAELFGNPQNDRLKEFLSKVL